MLIVILLAIIWMPDLVSQLDARRARTVSPGPPIGAQRELVFATERDTSTEDPPAWTALDDRQLTQLLTNSAPRTTNE
jgi:hypothetical protein